MYGSAEVIGLQLLPVLGTVCPREEAAPYAAALGKAFQLTNFLRDVDEDLARGPGLPARRRARRPRGGSRRADVVSRQPPHRCAAAPRAYRTARHHPARLRLRRARHRAAGAAVAAVRAGRATRCTRRSWTASRTSTSPSSVSAPPSAPRRRVQRRGGGPGQGVARAADPRERSEHGPLAIPVRAGARAWCSPRRWSGSAPACTGQPGGPLLAVRRWRRCSSSGTCVAIAAHVWTYNPRYVVRRRAAGALPVEELLFFLVIPVCGLLTYAAVDGILDSAARGCATERGGRRDRSRLHAARRRRGDRRGDPGARRAGAPGCSAGRPTGSRW